MAAPGRLAVLAERAPLGGTGLLDVGLYDGTTRISVTGIDQGGEQSWAVASVNLPAADATWRIQWQHQGIQSSDSVHNIFAVSLFPYEA